MTTSESETDHQSIAFYFERQLIEACNWLHACLNMVEGDGIPPNWDGIRQFLKENE